ncbi:MAG: hypothetical protein JJ863_12460 [Deltaproteobacteria bacterium]|nr:hypothetical protein [Deltaproteobacteria bacterium]
MRLASSVLALLAGCTVLTSPGDYEGGSVDGGIRCDRDGECPTGFCDTDRGQCVECRTDDHCSGAEECNAGSCGPETCGGEVCPDSMPACLVEGTAETCVECVSATDCPPGESCADNDCESCTPETACAATEACVVDPGGDYCVDCDADGDGAIRPDPECAGVPGERDCDDDGDGFCRGTAECAGECDEIVVDCDDADADVRPVITACGAPGVTTCSDPGDLLPGVGASSFSALALGELPEPIERRVRTPMSLVAETTGGFFDVIHLQGVESEGYADRVRRVVDIDARELRIGALPTTELRDFTDLRAKHDPEGVVIGTLGSDAGGMKSIEAMLLTSFEGAMVGSVLSYNNAGAVPPIDVSVENLAMGVPYVVWCSERGDVYDLVFGSSTTSSEMGALTPADSPIVSTARGLVSAGIRETTDLLYWDPRAVFSGNETRDEGGSSALAAGEGTNGFDARFTGGEMVVRAITFTEGGYDDNDPTSLDGADASSRVAIGAYNDVGYVVFDGATGSGARRIFASRLGSSSGATVATAPVELTGTDSPDFTDIHGLEVAARTSAGVVEIAVLVHGTLEGGSEPGLYLYLARRCGS